MFVGLGHGSVFRRHLARDDARVLQGAAVPGRGQRDPRAFAANRICARWAACAKKIPITCGTLFCAGVAIAGVPPFPASISKDAILAAAYQQAPWMYWVGVITAGMTAFYVFRASVSWCFFGRALAATSHHADHESPPSMWIPLAILAVLSLGGGLHQHPEIPGADVQLAEEGESRVADVRFRGRSGLGGIALAYLFYRGLARHSRKRWPRLSAVRIRWIYNKYYVDEFYDATVVDPVVDGSRELLWRVADVRIDRRRGQRRRQDRAGDRQL